MNLEKVIYSQVSCLFFWEVFRFSTPYHGLYFSPVDLDWNVWRLLPAHYIIFYTPRPELNPQVEFGVGVPQRLMRE